MDLSEFENKETSSKKIVEELFGKKSASGVPHSGVMGGCPGSQEREFIIDTDQVEEAKKQAKPGNHIGHISQKIQEIIEKAGYNCAQTLTGHGIGRKLHEPPSIPCFLRGRIENLKKQKNHEAV